VPVPPEPTGVDRLAELVGKAQTDDERSALLRHLARFRVGDGKDDHLLRRLGLVRDRRRKTPPPPSLDRAKGDRRVEQLEALRRRGLVTFLDHVHSALAWLALHQGDDGSFSTEEAERRCRDLRHRPDCVQGSSHDDDVPATALALLAFLAFRDQDAETGWFEPTLAHGFAWLRREQRGDGSFRGGNVLATTAMAALALSRGAESSGRQDLRSGGAKALGFLARAIGPDGGLGAAPGEPGRLEVSVWAAMAVESARRGGVAVPSALEDGLARFVRAVWREGSRFDASVEGDDDPRLHPAGMRTVLALAPRDVGEGTFSTWRAALGREELDLAGLHYAVGVSTAVEESPGKPLLQQVRVLAALQEQKGDGAGSFAGLADARRVGVPIATALAALTLLEFLSIR
jgi:hypothetical protein